jgi:hypothetical protein
MDMNSNKGKKIIPGTYILQKCLWKMMNKVKFLYVRAYVTLSEYVCVCVCAHSRGEGVHTLHLQYTTLYYPHISLEGLGKTKEKLLKNSWFGGEIMNQAPPRYKSECYC